MYHANIKCAMAPCLPLKEQAVLRDCFASPVTSLASGGAVTLAWLTPLRGGRNWIFSHHEHLEAEPHEAANHTAK